MEHFLDLDKKFLLL